jgi:hypothetical protein
MVEEGQRKIHAWNWFHVTCKVTRDTKLHVREGGRHFSPEPVLLYVILLALHCKKASFYLHLYRSLIKGGKGTKLPLFFSFVRSRTCYCIYICVKKSRIRCFLARARHSWISNLIFFSEHYCIVVLVVGIVVATVLHLLSDILVPHGAGAWLPVTQTQDTVVWSLRARVSRLYVSCEKEISGRGQQGQGSYVFDKVFRCPAQIS